MSDTRAMKLIRFAQLVPGGHIRIDCVPFEAPRPDGELLAVRPGTDDDASALRQRFAADLVKDDWFRAAPELVAYVECLPGGRGKGTIDRLPSGRWRVRVPDGKGKRRTIGAFDTWDEGNQQRLVALQVVGSREMEPPNENTLRALGAQWLKAKSIRRPKSARHYQDRWDHIQLADFIDDDVTLIDRDDIAGLITRWQQHKVFFHGATHAMHPKTLRDSFQMLKAIFTDAQLKNVIPSNPCFKQDLPRIPKKDEDDDDEKWLELDEQTAVLTHPKVPEPDAVVVGFEIGSGLRATELIWLPLEKLRKAVRTGKLQVHVAGPNGEEPKNGKRTVPLVEFAIEYAKRWLEILPEYCPPELNTMGLAFPKANGEAREKNRILGSYGNDGISRWHHYRELAGIEKRVTWHGLRHTCASSLFSGLWGKTWSPQAVSKYLGDTEAVTLKYYARMSRRAVADLAKETRGGPVDQVTIRSRSGVGSAVVGAKLAVIPGGSEIATPASCSSIGVPAVSGGYLGPDAARDLLSRANDFRSRVAAGWRPSLGDSVVFIAVIEATIRAGIPVLKACDAAKEPGPYQLNKLLELCDAVDALLAGLDEAQAREGTR